MHRNISHNLNISIILMLAHLDALPISTPTKLTTMRALNRCISFGTEIIGAHARRENVGKEAR
jgi:hypothetical protein